ncbi:thioesterase II family protein [Streptomyces sp. AJS327]|uniref:thioesterase II family protein n=1 Tax=Streptomyces sp. AJS327 TaxID=2545265 RepID=UPI0015DDC33F|nr:thioesterase [Streptomyces sp. AJS327]
MPHTSWIRLSDAPSARLRLFCFPHAGAGAATYRPWGAALAPGIQVCAVVPPGRESRVRERPHRRIEELLPPLVEAVAAHADRPYAIFGHSTGAAVGYEVARALAARDCGPPVCLAVSGRRPPALPADTAHHLLPDAEFVAALRHLGGLDGVGEPDGPGGEPSVEARLWRLLLPGLRADFELHETYRELPGEPLTIPVLACAGADDPAVTPGRMGEWRHTTRGPFRQRTFPGGHFYLTAVGDPEGAVPRALRETLTELGALAHPGTGRSG